MNSSLFDLLNNPDGIDGNNYDYVFDTLSDKDRKKRCSKSAGCTTVFSSKIVQEHFGASSEGLLTLFNYQDIDQIPQDLVETVKALKEDEKAEQELKTCSAKPTIRNVLACWKTYRFLKPIFIRTILNLKSQSALFRSEANHQSGNYQGTAEILQ